MMKNAHLIPILAGLIAMAIMIICGLYFRNPPLFIFGFTALSTFLLAVAIT